MSSFDERAAEYAETLALHINDIERGIKVPPLSPGLYLFNRPVSIVWHDQIFYSVELGVVTKTFEMFTCSKLDNDNSLNDEDGGMGVLETHTRGDIVDGGNHWRCVHT